MTDDPRMVPATRLGIDVHVRIDDTWWPGTLEHWRQREDRWEGWVRWTKAPGETHHASTSSMSQIRPDWSIAAGSGKSGRRASRCTCWRETPSSAATSATPASRRRSTREG